ncbi:MAG: hypothetical protein PF448_08395 [Bacteroidales bacterium]|jgi:hypothetical protein|nr:hypothetical protein [Bacteroidales bacterium]
MQKLIRWFFAFLALACVGSAFAQDRIGSPYTRYGVGDLLSRNFGDSKAMGGTSLALRSTNKLYVANPASYSAIDSLNFVMEVGLTAALKRMESENQNAVLNDFNLDYLSFGFPVTNWWGASFGLLPYSNVGYDLMSTESFQGLEANYHYAGSGGMNQAYFGSSFKLNKSLSLGVNVNYLFGSIHRTNAVTFSRDDPGMVNVTEKNSMYFSDFYLSLGLQYDWQLNDDNNLTLGLMWENNSELNAKQDLLVTNALSISSSAVIDTLLFQGDQEGTVTLPMSVGAGVAYEHSDKLILAADFYLQDWTNAQMFGETDSLGLSQRVSLGVEWTPDGKNSPGLKYWKKVRYRGGAYYNNTYLQFNQGDTQIDDFGISFGLGLPLKRSNTTFNLSLELGQRGSLQNNLVREQYLVVGMNFSLSDIWFIKRKFD